MLLSVIIPIYNSADTIERCLKSVLSAGVSDMEIIVIDDESTDNSLNILNDLAKKDHRIRILTQSHSGPANARNLGLKHIRGQYVTFIDADDTVEPMTYQQAVNQMANADLVSWGINLININFPDGYFSFLKGRYQILLEDGTYDLTLTNIKKTRWAIWNKMFKTDVIKKYDITFCPDIYMAEDFTFLFKYIAHVKNFYHINQPLYNWYKEQKSLVGQYILNRQNKSLDHLTALIDLYNHYQKYHLIESKNDILSHVFESGILRDVQTSTPGLGKRLLEETSNQLKKLNPSLQSKMVKNLIQKKYRKIPELNYPPSALQKTVYFFKRIHRTALQQTENDETLASVLNQTSVFDTVRQAHKNATRYADGSLIDLHLIRFSVIKPTATSKNAVAFELTEQNSVRLSVTFQSVLDNLPHHNCDVIFFTRNTGKIPLETIRRFYNQAADYPHVTCHFVDMKDFLSEQSSFMNALPLWIFIPQSCQKFKRVLFLTPNMLALKPINLFGLRFNHEQLAAVAGKQTEETENLPVRYPDYNFLLFNTSEISLSNYYKKLYILKTKLTKNFTQTSLLNALFEGYIKKLNKFFCYPTTAWQQEQNIQDAPFFIRLDNLNASKHLLGNDYFFKYAKKSPVYEQAVNLFPKPKIKFSLILPPVQTVEEAQFLSQNIFAQTERSINVLYDNSDTEIEKVYAKMPRFKPFSPQNLTGEWIIYLPQRGYFKDQKTLSDLYEKIDKIKAAVFETPVLINQLEFDQTLLVPSDTGEKSILTDVPNHQKSLFVLNTDFIKKHALINALTGKDIWDILSVAKHWHRLNDPVWVKQTTDTIRTKEDILSYFEKQISDISAAATHQLDFIKNALIEKLYADLESRYLATVLLSEDELKSLSDNLLNLLGKSFFALNKWPKISVITPCFNGEKYLPAFLNSLLNQTYPNFELIFIDDGSTDHTKQIIDEYQPLFDQKKIPLLYRYQENQGQAAAINTGLQLYSGDFFTWPDADDILYPDCLFKKAAFLINHPETDMVTHALNVVWEKQPDKAVKIFHRLITPGQNDDFFTDLIDEKNILFPPLAFMVRSASFKKAVPQNHIYPGQGGQNLQMLLPVAWRGKFGYINETLGSYVQHNSSHSNSFSNRFELMNIHIKTIRETVNNIPNLTDEMQQIVAQKLTDRQFRHFNYENHRNVNGSYVENSGCTGCAACMNACPVSAIKMKADENGFLYPTIDPKKCIKCHKCIHVCPGLNPSDQPPKTPTAFIARATDAVRRGSTSGGIFTALATHVLQNGGYVCGASLQPDLEVKHVLISDIKDLDQLRTSKYVQSNIHMILSAVKTVLDAQKTVLFSGTPCQIIGLKAFLKKEYDHLICVDIVCHGVPSQKLFRQYLNENYAHQQINTVAFRPNSKPWGKNSCIEVNGQNAKTPMDIFTRAFLSNLCLRSSCYQCPAAHLKRASDLTIGDFWGIDEYQAGLRDFYGTSVILNHTDKGEKLLTAIQNDLTLFNRVTFEQALVKNPNIITPSEKNPGRMMFLKYTQNMRLDNAANTLLTMRYDAVLLNYWFANNYGAALTAFALQQLLKQNGLKTAYANYIPDQFNKWNDAFTPFVLNKLTLTYPLKTPQDLKHLNGLTGTFITGSDQVFNPQIYKTHGGEIYLLNFTDLNKKKLAFSASFGDDIYSKATTVRFLGSDGEQKMAEHLLSRFNAISIREQSGIKIMHTICPTVEWDKISHLMDPVFLIGQQNWIDLADESDLTLPNNYYASLFYYERHKQLLPDIKGKLKHPLWDMSGIGYTPESFLKIIRGSNGVITDSFHAFCFALIFKKPCVFIARHKQTNRVKDLIETFRLKPTVLYSKSDFGKLEKMLSVRQNFKQIHKILVAEREKAQQWIQKYIKMPG